MGLPARMISAGLNLDSTETKSQDEIKFENADWMRWRSKPRKRRHSEHHPTTNAKDTLHLRLANFYRFVPLPLCALWTVRNKQAKTHPIFSLHIITDMPSTHWRSRTMAQFSEFRGISTKSIYSPSCTKGQMSCHKGQGWLIFWRCCWTPGHPHKNVSRMTHAVMVKLSPFDTTKTWTRWKSKQQTILVLRCIKPQLFIQAHLLQEPVADARGTIIQGITMLKYPDPSYNEAFSINKNHKPLYPSFFTKTQLKVESLSL